MGTRSAWARALAVATPTRSPVNSPGPTSTATTPTSCRSISACSQMNAIAGVRISAWRRPRAAWKDASTPSCPPRAQPTCEVAVSMPSTIIASSLSPGRQPWRQEPLQVVNPPGPAQADGTHHDDPLLLVLPVVEVHVQPVGRKHTSGQVGPLDAGHGAPVELLEQRQVDHFAQPVQAIEVGMQEQQLVAAVGAHQRERGAGDRLVDAQAAGEA